MARTLTPAEWAELERAQREGGIPNVAPDSSMRFEGDMQLRPAPQRELQGIQEDIGQVKDKAVGLLGQVDWPDRIRGGYETADIPTQEQPEWLSAEYELSKQTGLSMEASEFFLQFSDALENSREDAQAIFNQWWPYLSPKDRDQLNVHLNISPPVEYGLAP